MFLRTLYLHNFRAYKEALFEFGPGINMIWGDNAQGKTTILEAIHFLMLARSFRTAQVSDLNRQGTGYFYLEAAFSKHDVDQKIKFSCRGKERRIICNNSPCPNVSSLIGMLQGVTMTPDDVALVKGAPQLRRRFLDLQIAQADPLYVHHSTRYARALQQRNALLRAKSAVAIEGWEHEMAHAAAYIVAQRSQTVEDLNATGKRLHHLLSSPKETFGVAYKSGSPFGEGQDALLAYYQDRFQKHRYREMDLGFTLCGPHKDDLIIMLDGKEARYFASEGQQRSCVAALRMAEWERLKHKGEEMPLMLIDDVGVSLDASRRESLFGYLQELGQVFLTSTENLPIIEGQTSIKL